MTIYLNLRLAPDIRPVSGTLNNKAHFIDHDMQPRESRPALLKFSMPDVDFDLLIKDTLDAVKLHGLHQYRIGRDTEGNPKNDSGYLGMGLTYNPRHVDGRDVDPHQQVQGNHNPGAKGYQGANPFSRINGDEALTYSKKNTHYDTYSMCYRTPGSKHGYLGKFVDSFKRTMVRSSIRTIDASSRDGQTRVNGEQLAGVSWHTDESMFENLRINIPVVTDPIFVLEQQGSEPVHLQAGYAYTWDTGLLHRAYTTQITDQPVLRTHIMLGFSCWWDFDERTDTWRQNEFFGRKHPQDMLVDGDVIPNLQLIQ